MQSRLNPDIRYKEVRGIEPEDENREAVIYQIMLPLGKTIILAGLGLPKNTFEKMGVVYIPLYLITKHAQKSAIQIGVYEHRQEDFMMDSGKPELWGEFPLLYSFVSEDWLLNERWIPEEGWIMWDGENGTEPNEKEGENGKGDEETNNREKGIAPARRGLFTLTVGAQVPSRLKEETPEDAKSETNNYKEDQQDNWIQKYMKNKNYTIVDNEGGGDCFFATIRDAFSMIGQQTTISQLRKRLGEEATEDLFKEYQKVYSMYKAALAEQTQQLKDLQKEYKAVQQQFQNEIDRDQRKEMVEKASSIQRKHDQMALAKKTTMEIVKEYKYMEKIDSLSAFQLRIQSCDFWATPWALSTMERILNIKLFVFSEDAYHEEDIGHVLMCGADSIDPVIQKRGLFEPDLYMMVSRKEANYKLVVYKQKALLSFSELPFHLKRMTVDKCVEKDAGVFPLIQEFRNFRLVYGSPSKGPPREDDSDATLGIPDYDDQVVFCIYHKSADKPSPGKGAGEKINEIRRLEFVGLLKQPNWRRKLDDDWEEAFSLDGKTWKSVEHYYQASKFKKGNHGFYLTFSLDSGSELSENVEMSKHAGDKNGIWKGERIRGKEIQIDPDFYDGRSGIERKSAQQAKFKQHPDLSNVLLLTKNALLVHYIQGKEAEPMWSLMKVRTELASEKAIYKI